jgi:hypothetical protein
MIDKKSSRMTLYYPWILGVLVIHSILVDGYLIYSYLQKSNVLGETTESVCPQACIARINQISGNSINVSKEYFVPLGSGSSASTEWVDVPGAASTINTASYGRIKSVIFESTTAIPSGGHRIWIRLYNATDKHPVWYSEMTTDQSIATLLTSSQITLDKGNKLYQVQMKQQLPNAANLVQSRVKITTY